MFQKLLNNFLEIKREYIQKYKPKNIIAEILPNEHSDFFPIDNQVLKKLHQFLCNNKIYFKKTDIWINNHHFISYEGDVNEFYLSSKKYDTNYQPFYPTWLFSAFLLSLQIKEIGFKELIDIGAGDGRIPYCASILDIRSIGIELDTDLTKLQNDLCKKTAINFEIINEDATRYNFKNLELSKPIFVLSGLPEMGEMFVNNIMKESLQYKFELFGIVFLGSTIKRQFQRDIAYFGWGEVIKKNNLKVINEINLPTHWTNDNNTETKYLITKTLS